jgi:hypothetical protein
MKDPERRHPEAERVKDLEVSEDEARDIAGGKKSPRKKIQARKSAQSMHRREA